MRLVTPSYEILNISPEPDVCLQKLERIGRSCYKSEDKITKDSAPRFVRNLLKMGRMETLRDSFSKSLLGYLETYNNPNYSQQAAFHDLLDALIFSVGSMEEDSPHESVIEHSLITVQFVFDRGVSHEIVRHRLAAFTQESTRYCNYTKGSFGNEISVITPSFWEQPDSEENVVKFHLWKQAMEFAEHIYADLIAAGAKPQEARSVLPNSLKTEIVVSANFREWRHIFRMRTSKRAHPQMYEVMRPLLKELRGMVPVIFDDVGTTEGY